MSDDRIHELSPETGRSSAPQLVDNTIDWGDLDYSVFDPPQDLFLHHLHSHTSTLISAPTPPVADLWISAPTQQKEQCVMNMAAKNVENDRMLPADNNKQLAPKTQGISQPSFVASTSDLRRKGKQVHQNTKEAEYNDKGKRESKSSSSTKKVRRRHTPNLAEKKRRVRIKEQFKNLQQLVQLNGKVHQLSILETAITQIKLLQQEVQDAETSGQCNINIINAAPTQPSNSEFPNN